jgi:hypothetical protein
MRVCAEFSEVPLEKQCAVEGRVQLQLMDAWRLLPFSGLGERGRPARSRRRLADGLPWNMSTTYGCTLEGQISGLRRGEFGRTLIANNLQLEMKRGQ